MSESTDDIAKTLGLGQSRGRSVLWIGLAVVVFIGAGVWFWLQSGNANDRFQYVATAVDRGELIVTVTATGTVEPTNLVEVSSELSGTLATVEVDFNDEVEVGTVLARLDVTKLEAQVAIFKASLNAAIAGVSRAEAMVQDARAKFETARDLDQRGITSHQVFVTHEASYRAALADLQAALADLRLAEAQLDFHEAELEKACICSPIRGIVLDRAVDPGQIIAASLSAPVLFTVAEDLHQMELQVDIDEADIGRVKRGNPAQFSVEAYDDRYFPAEISELRFAPQTIDGVVTYKAILSIDNSDLLLRPGMTATADITVTHIEDALIVPNAALRYTPPMVHDEAGDDRSGLLGMLLPERLGDGPEANRNSVWVLRDGTAVEVLVEPGNSDGRSTQIIGGDLAEGDRVITRQLDG